MWNTIAESTLKGDDLAKFISILTPTIEYGATLRLVLRSAEGASRRMLP